MPDAKSGRVHILRQLAIPGGVAAEDTGNHLLLSVTGRSECCRSGSEISRAGLYQRQGAKWRCRSVEGGWLFNDLKKESRRPAWGTKSAALRTRDKIDFMRILSPDPAKYLSLRKCYPSRMPLKSATTSATRANQVTGCNNVTCPVAGEITIRQPQLCWLPFANDFYACHSNIKRRASRSTNDNLRALDYCHLQYHIPTGAEVIAGLAT